MKGYGRLDPELEALLERGRTIGRWPDVMRARVLARARATAAAAKTAPEPELAVTIAARRHRLQVAFAASIALALGAAGTAAALLGRAPHRSEPAPMAHAARSPVRTKVAEAVPAPTRVAPPASSVGRSHTERPANARESYAAELALLQRAQVVYKAGDFPAALALVAEHTRRFPKGRLAEDREALRVRSLAGSGRRDDARRAVAAFEQRFPRSVLLPRLQEAAGTEN